MFSLFQITLLTSKFTPFLVNLDTTFKKAVYRKLARRLYHQSIYLLHQSILLLLGVLVILCYINIRSESPQTLSTLIYEDDIKKNLKITKVTFSISSRDENDSQFSTEELSQLFTRTSRGDHPSSSL